MKIQSLALLCATLAVVTECFPLKTGSYEDVDPLYPSVNRKFISVSEQRLYEQFFADLRDSYTSHDGGANKRQLISGKEHVMRSRAIGGKDAWS
ncbi:hypothetical protein MAR_029104 [Mya arenaria]|uniref:Uncharacterized protein n=1 Tax=Mya arenaria TaxID=6604 RepID=A0ABY7DGI7_MYAAR|nr:hypothetical protein MAR_029104 [Mya arenaria]